MTTPSPSLRPRYLLVPLALLWVAALAPAAWAQPDDVPSMTQLARLVRWSGVLTSALVIAGAWMLLRVMRDFVERLSQQFGQHRLLLQKIATFIQFFVYVGTAISVLLLSLRLDDKVLALIGGTIAVSVGFALKDLVASFIAGIMILIDRPFQVGDRVSFVGQYGDITAIGLRSVRLQTLDDNTVTIPNNKFLNDVTSCGNYGQLDMQVVMDFLVGADQDLDVPLRIVREACVTSRFVHLPRPITVLVHQVVVDSMLAVRLRLKAYVLDTQYEKAFESDVNRRVLTAFHGAGVTLPAVLHRHVGGPPTQPNA